MIMWSHVQLEIRLWSTASREHKKDLGELEVQEKEKVKPERL